MYVSSISTVWRLYLITVGCQTNINVALQVAILDTVESIILHKLIDHIIKTFNIIAYSGAVKLKVHFYSH